MSKIRRWQVSTALLLSLSLGAGTVTPIVTSLIVPPPAIAQTTNFTDVSANHWAAGFISALVEREIVAGFPDGTFKPDAPVTRAQFAAMVRKALPKAKIRGSAQFVDVATNYWAYSAIQEAYEMGFLSGYPGQQFKPNQNIPREQVLVALANGLNYTASMEINTTLAYYSDAGSISNFARSPIAAATEKKLVVNYPTLKNLNPKRNATRAEVAAFIYQALVSQGEAQTISSQYIVSQEVVTTNYRIPAGTVIPVAYQREKILLTKDETVPVTLNLAANITSADGTVIIPGNSEIVGELRPSNGGTQFVAQQLILANGTSLDIDATSEVITKTETVRKGTDTGTLVKNAALGTAAAAAIAAVTGDRAIATEELLLGAGAGILATLIPQFLGLNKIDLLVVEPNTNLPLTLNSDLLLEK